MSDLSSFGEINTHFVHLLVLFIFIVIRGACEFLEHMCMSVDILYFPFSPLRMEVMRIELKTLIFGSKHLYPLVHATILDSPDF